MIRVEIATNFVQITWALRYVVNNSLHNMLLMIGSCILWILLMVIAPTLTFFVPQQQKLTLGDCHGFLWIVYLIMSFSAFAALKHLFDRLDWQVPNTDQSHAKFVCKVCLFTITAVTTTSKKNAIQIKVVSIWKEMSVVNICNPLCCLSVRHFKYKWHLGQDKKCPNHLPWSAENGQGEMSFLSHTPYWQGDGALIRSILHAYSLSLDVKISALVTRIKKSSSWLQK